MSEKAITGLEQGKYMICAEGSQDPCRPDVSMDAVLDSNDRILFANENAPSGNGPMVINMNMPVTVREFISSHRFASSGSPMDRLAIVKTFAKKHDHITKVDPSLVQEAKVFQGIWEKPDAVLKCKEPLSDAASSIAFMRQLDGHSDQLTEMRVQIDADQRTEQCAKGLGIEDNLVNSALDVYGVESGWAYKMMEKIPFFFMR